jgi:peptide/nickel transport system permease protein
MSIHRYVLLRALQAIPVLAGVVVINFVLIHAAPGDPTYYIIGEADVSQDFVDRLRADMGLDQPTWVQLWRYFRKIASGDLGYSLVSSASVLSLILDRLPATLLLMGTQYVLSALLGIGLGLVSAYKPNSPLDISVTVFSLVGYAMPLFWLGQMLVLTLAFHLGWFPIHGMYDLRQGYTGLAHALDVAHHLVLPTLTLSLFNMALIVRLTRSSMLQVLGQEYIMVARSKGVAERHVLVRHGLRNALLPVVTVMGMHFRTLIAGAVLTETVFAWPGIGRLTYDAIFARDYPLLMGVFVFTCVMVIVGNLLTDVVYSYLDPRIRYR